MQEVGDGFIRDIDSGHRLSAETAFYIEST